ncbi:MAG: peptidoglycan DD-metalloendopeptidase family protein [Polyangiaceae bacterium]|jgi:murein DD-endopeptidase MepM/ murein hydrolase activator NlpD
MRIPLRFLFAAVALVAPSVAAEPGGSPVERPSDPTLALASLDRGLADLDGEEQGARAELSRLDARVARAHERVVAHGRSYYRLTRAGLLPLGGGFDALVTHAMHVERARRVVTADIREERSAHARAEELQQDLERLERDRASMVTQRQAIEATRLEHQEDRRRQDAFDKAFETSTGAGADYVAVYGGAGAGAPEMPAGGFASARGRLLFPVAARAEVRPAHREGTDGPGLEMHAAAGSVVRAAFAARVAFADRYGPYGRIVILDHGDHYYTVSGNLDAVDVKIGQDVGAGDRLGTVGDDGAGPMLYFEVRHGSQAIPPAPWLGL